MARIRFTAVVDDRCGMGPRLDVTIPEPKFLRIPKTSLPRRHHKLTFVIFTWQQMGDHPNGKYLWYMYSIEESPINSFSESCHVESLIA